MVAGPAEERLLDEIDAAIEDVEQDLTEAEFVDPATYAASALNNLPAIKYATSLGLPVIEWKPAVKNAGSEERALRASRSFSESARLLLAMLMAGAMTEEQFYNAMGDEFRRYARNSYISGRRAVGVLAPLTEEEIEDFEDLIADDMTALGDWMREPTGMGLGTMIAYMVLDPTNYLGSGLPGDPFAGLPPPIGAGKKSLKSLEKEAANLIKRGKVVPPSLQKRIAQAMAREAAQKDVGKFARRVEQYADRIYNMQHAGEQAAMRSYIPEEATLVWWSLGPADHCIDCVRLADGSPYYANTLGGAGIHPGSGHTRCGGKCRCHLEWDVPSQVCTDPLAGAGSLGDLVVEASTDLVESSDGERMNVWVQEAATCSLPASIDSFAADVAPPEGEITDDLAYEWGDDISSVITGSVSTSTIAWSALEDAIRLGRNLPGLDSPGGLREVLSQFIPGNLDDLFLTKYEAAGSIYHVAWRRLAGAIRIEFGATTKGIALLDPEFALRALSDLAEEATRRAVALEVNGSTATNGLATFLSVLGADRLLMDGVSPTVVPRFADGTLVATAHGSPSLPGLVTSHTPPATPLTSMKDVTPKPKEGPAHIVMGVTPKRFLEDETGQRWLVKFEGPTKQQGVQRALPEAVATQVHETLGNRVAAAGVSALEGQGVTVQRIIPSRALTAEGYPVITGPMDMTIDQRVELMRQWVTDLLMGNTDGHLGNWMIEPDGTLLGIDKGLAFWNLPTYRYRLDGDALRWVEAEDVSLLSDQNMGQLFLRKTTVGERWGFNALDGVSPAVVDEMLARIAAWSDDEYMAIAERLIPGLMAGSRDSLVGRLMGPAEWRRVMLAQKQDLAAMLSRTFRDNLSSVAPDTYIPSVWRKWLKDGGQFLTTTPPTPRAARALATELMPGPVVRIRVLDRVDGAVARWVSEEQAVHLGRANLEALDELGARKLYDLAYDSKGKAHMVDGVRLPPDTVSVYGGDANVFAHEVGHAFEEGIDLTDADMVAGLGVYDPDRGFVGMGPDLGAGAKERVWRNPSEAAADAFADYVQAPERMNPEALAWMEARLAERPEWRGFVDALRAQPDPRYWAPRGSVETLPLPGVNGRPLLPEVEALGAYPPEGLVLATTPDATLPPMAPVRWANAEEMIADLTTRHGGDFSYLADLDFELASEGMAELDTIFARFGVPEGFKGVRRPAKENIAINAEWSGADGWMELPRWLWGDPKVFRQRAEDVIDAESISQALGSARAMARSVVAHELGHAYSEHVVGNIIRIRLGAKADEVQAWVRAHLKAHYRFKGFVTAVEATDADLADVVGMFSYFSRLSRTNAHEAWAELFTATVGPAQSQHSEAVAFRALLDRLYPVGPGTAPVALPGTTGKRLLTAPGGGQFVFAVEGAEEEIAAAALMHRLGLRVPPATRMEIDGQIGAVLPWVPGRDIRAAKIAARDLTSDQMTELARQSVVDYLIGNMDAHVGNWLIDDAGRLWGIDRGRAFAGLATAPTTPSDFIIGLPVADAIASPGFFLHVSPRRIGEVLDQIDSITDAEFLALIGDRAIDTIRLTKGGAPERQALLLKRRAGLRKGFSALFREQAKAAKPGTVSDEWAAWLKAGGRFAVEPAPTAPVAAAVKTILPAPVEAVPVAARAANKGMSVVGTNHAVYAASFIPATTKGQAVARLTMALPNAQGNVLDGFTLDQLNAILARAEHMRATGVDMSLLTRLGDFTKVPPLDRADVAVYGLTYGDKVALRHNGKWWATTQKSRATVYDDIGGLFAHEYGHVVWNRMGTSAQTRMIALYNEVSGRAVKDLSLYAEKGMDEWVGEVMALLTAPDYVPGTLAYDEAFWGILAADGKVTVLDVAKAVPAALPEGVEKALVWPNATSLIADSESVGVLGKTSTRRLLIDPNTQQRYVFIPGEQRMRDPVLVELGRSMGLRLPERQFVTLADGSVGALYPYTATAPLPQLWWTSITDEQALDVAQHSVLDYITGNTVVGRDSFGVDITGRVWGLDTALMPDAPIDAREFWTRGQGTYGMLFLRNDSPIFEHISPADLEAIFARLVAIPDGDFLKAMEVVVKGMRTPDGKPLDVSKTLVALLKRKKTVSAEYARALRVRIDDALKAKQPVSDEWKAWLRKGGRFGSSAETKVVKPTYTQPPFWGGSGYGHTTQPLWSVKPEPVFVPPHSPIGPPKAVGDINSWGPADPQQYLLPDSPVALNAPRVEWSGKAPPEPDLPSLGVTAEQKNAARAAHDAVVKTWKDVDEGRVERAFAWGTKDSEEARKAGLHVEKVGDSWVVAKGPTDLDPLKAHLAAGGTTGDDTFWGLMGYSKADLDAYDAWYAIRDAKALSLRAGVMVVEPDGRMWVLAPRNRFAGYENTVVKGGVDAGETTAQAAVREVMEEVGLSVELDSFLGDFINSDGTAISRMYIGHRTGGGPLWAKVKETHRVRLVTADEARTILTRYGKPDVRDQAVLEATVKALDGHPGAPVFKVGAEDVAEFAGKTSPTTPVIPGLTKYVPPPKPYGGGGYQMPPWKGWTPKPGIVEQPPASVAFGFDHTVVNEASALAVDAPPHPTFPMSTTIYTLADGTKQPMYWKDEIGGLFWGNAKKQVTDPQLRFNLHVAQLRRLGQQFETHLAYAELRVNQTLLDQVPKLREMLIAAGGKSEKKVLSISRENLLALVKAIDTNTPLTTATAFVPAGAAVPGPTMVTKVGQADLDVVKKVVGNIEDIEWVKSPPTYDGKFTLVLPSGLKKIVSFSVANGEATIHLGAQMTSEPEFKALVVTALAKVYATAETIPIPPSRYRIALWDAQQYPAQAAWLDSFMAGINPDLSTGMGSVAVMVWHEGLTAEMQSVIPGFWFTDLPITSGIAPPAAPALVPDASIHVATTAKNVGSVSMTHNGTKYQALIWSTPNGPASKMLWQEFPEAIHWVAPPGFTIHIPGNQTEKMAVMLRHIEFLADVVDTDVALKSLHITEDVWKALPTDLRQWITNQPVSMAITADGSRIIERQTLLDLRALIQQAHPSTAQTQLGGSMYPWGTHPLEAWKKYLGTDDFDDIKNTFTFSQAYAAGVAKITGPGWEAGVRDIAHGTVRRITNLTATTSNPTVNHHIAFLAVARRLATNLDMTPDVTHVAVAKIAVDGDVAHFLLVHGAKSKADNWLMTVDQFKAMVATIDAPNPAAVASQAAMVPGPALPAAYTKEAVVMPWNEATIDWQGKPHKQATYQIDNGNNVDLIWRRNGNDLYVEDFLYTDQYSATAALELHLRRMAEYVAANPKVKSMRISGTAIGYVEPESPLALAMAKYGKPYGSGGFQIAPADLAPMLDEVSGLPSVAKAAPVAGTFDGAAVAEATTVEKGIADNVLDALAKKSADKKKLEITGKGYLLDLSAYGEYGDVGWRRLGNNLYIEYLSGKPGFGVAPEGPVHHEVILAQIIEFGKTMEAYPAISGARILNDALLPIPTPQREALMDMLYAAGATDYANGLKITRQQLLSLRDELVGGIKATAPIPVKPPLVTTANTVEGVLGVNVKGDVDMIAFHVFPNDAGEWHLFGPQGEIEAQFLGDLGAGSAKVTLTNITVSGDLKSPFSDHDTIIGTILGAAFSGPDHVPLGKDIGVAVSVIDGNPGLGPKLLALGFEPDTYVWTLKQEDIPKVLAAWDANDAALLPKPIAAQKVTLPQGSVEALHPTPTIKHQIISTDQYGASHGYSYTTFNGVHATVTLDLMHIESEPLKVALTLHGAFDGPALAQVNGHALLTVIDLMKAQGADGLSFDVVGPWGSAFMDVLDAVGGKMVAQRYVLTKEQALTLGKALDSAWGRLPAAKVLDNVAAAGPSDLMAALSTSEAKYQSLKAMLPVGGDPQSIGDAWYSKPFFEDAVSLSYAIPTAQSPVIIGSVLVQGTMPDGTMANAGAAVTYMLLDTPLRDWSVGPAGSGLAFTDAFLLDFPEMEAALKAYGATVDGMIPGLRLTDQQAKQFLDDLAAGAPMPTAAGPTSSLTGQLGLSADNMESLGALQTTFESTVIGEGIGSSVIADTYALWDNHASLEGKWAWTWNGSGQLGFWGGSGVGPSGTTVSSPHPMGEQIVMWLKALTDADAGIKKHPPGTVTEVLIGNAPDPIGDLLVAAGASTTTLGTGLKTYYISPQQLDSLVHHIDDNIASPAPLLGSAGTTIPVKHSVDIEGSMHLAGVDNPAVYMGKGKPAAPGLPVEGVVFAPNVEAAWRKGPDFYVAIGVVPMVAEDMGTDYQHMAELALLHHVAKKADAENLPLYLQLKPDGLTGWHMSNEAESLAASYFHVINPNGYMVLAPEDVKVFLADLEAMADQYGVTLATGPAPTMNAATAAGLQPDSWSEVLFDFQSKWADPGADVAKKGLAVVFGPPGSIVPITGGGSEAKFVMSVASKTLKVATTAIDEPAGVGKVLAIDDLTVGSYAASEALMHKAVATGIVGTADVAQKAGYDLVITQPVMQAHPWLDPILAVHGHTLGGPGTGYRIKSDDLTDFITMLVNDEPLPGPLTLAPAAPPLPSPPPGLGWDPKVKAAAESLATDAIPGSKAYPGWGLDTDKAHLMVTTIDASQAATPQQGAYAVWALWPHVPGDGTPLTIHHMAPQAAADPVASQTVGASVISALTMQAWANSADLAFSPQLLALLDTDPSAAWLKPFLAGYTIQPDGSIVILNGHLPAWQAALDKGIPEGSAVLTGTASVTGASVAAKAVGPMAEYKVNLKTLSQLGTPQATEMAQKFGKLTYVISGGDVVTVKTWASQSTLRWVGYSGNPNVALEVGVQTILEPFTARVKASAKYGQVWFDNVDKMPPAWKQMLLDFGGTWHSDAKYNRLIMTRGQFLSMSEALQKALTAGSMPGAAAAVAAAPSVVGLSPAKAMVAKTMHSPADVAMGEKGSFVLLGPNGAGIAKVEYDWATNTSGAVVYLDGTTMLDGSPLTPDVALAASYVLAKKAERIKPDVDLFVHHQTYHTGLSALNAHGADNPATMYIGLYTQAEYATNGGASVSQSLVHLTQILDGTPPVAPVAGAVPPVAAGQAWEFSTKYGLDGSLASKITFPIPPYGGKQSMKMAVKSPDTPGFVWVKFKDLTKSIEVAAVTGTQLGTQAEIDAVGIAALKALAKIADNQQKTLFIPQSLFDKLGNPSVFADFGTAKTVKGQVGVLLDHAALGNLIDAIESDEVIMGAVKVATAAPPAVSPFKSSLPAAMVGQGKFLLNLQAGIGQKITLGTAAHPVVVTYAMGQGSLTVMAVAVDAQMHVGNWTEAVVASAADAAVKLHKDLTLMPGVVMQLEGAATDWAPWLSIPPSGGAAKVLDPAGLIAAMGGAAPAPAPSATGAMIGSAPLSATATVMIGAKIKHGSPSKAAAVLDLVTWPWGEKSVQMTSMQIAMTPNTYALPGGGSIAVLEVMGGSIGANEHVQAINLVDLAIAAKMAGAKLKLSPAITIEIASMLPGTWPNPLGTVLFDPDLILADIPKAVGLDVWSQIKWPSTGGTGAGGWTPGAVHVAGTSMGYVATIPSGTSVTTSVPNSFSVKTTLVGPYPNGDKVLKVTQQTATSEADEEAMILFTALVAKHNGANHLDIPEALYDSYSALLPNPVTKDGYVVTLLPEDILASAGLGAPAAAVTGAKHAALTLDAEAAIQSGMHKFKVADAIPSGWQMSGTHSIVTPIYQFSILPQVEGTTGKHILMVQGKTLVPPGSLAPVTHTQLALIDLAVAAKKNDALVHLSASISGTVTDYFPPLYKGGAPVKVPGITVGSMQEITFDPDVILANVPADLLAKLGVPPVGAPAAAALPGPWQVPDLADLAAGSPTLVPGGGKVASLGINQTFTYQSISAGDIIVTISAQPGHLTLHNIALPPGAPAGTLDIVMADLAASAKAAGVTVSVIAPIGAKWTPFIKAGQLQIDAVLATLPSVAPKALPVPLGQDALDHLAQKADAMVTWMSGKPTGSDIPYHGMGVTWKVHLTQGGSVLVKGGGQASADEQVVMLVQAAMAAKKSGGSLFIAPEILADYSTLQALAFDYKPGTASNKWDWKAILDDFLPGGAVPGAPAVVPSPGSPYGIVLIGTDQAVFQLGGGGKLTKKSWVMVPAQAGEPGATVIINWKDLKDYVAVGSMGGKVVAPPSQNGAAWVGLLGMAQQAVAAKKDLWVSDMGNYPWIKQVLLAAGGVPKSIKSGIISEPGTLIHATAMAKLISMLQKGVALPSVIPGPNPYSALGLIDEVVVGGSKIKAAMVSKGLSWGDELLIGPEQMPVSVMISGQGIILPNLQKVVGTPASPSAYAQVMALDAAIAAHAHPQMKNVWLGEEVVKALPPSWAPFISKPTYGSHWKLDWQGLLASLPDDKKAALGLWSPTPAQLVPPPQAAVPTPSPAAAAYAPSPAAAAPPPPPPPPVKPYVPKVKVVTPDTSYTDPYAVVDAWQVKLLDDDTATATLKHIGMTGDDDVGTVYINLKYGQASRYPKLPAPQAAADALPSPAGAAVPPAGAAPAAGTALGPSDLGTHYGWDKVVADNMVAVAKAGQMPEPGVLVHLDSPSVTAVTVKAVIQTSYNKPVLVIDQVTAMYGGLLTDGVRSAGLVAALRTQIAQYVAANPDISRIMIDKSQLAPGMSKLLVDAGWTEQAGRFVLKRAQWDQFVADLGSDAPKWLPASTISPVTAAQPMATPAVGGASALSHAGATLPHPPTGTDATPSFIFGWHPKKVPEHIAAAVDTEYPPIQIDVGGTMKAGGTPHALKIGSSQVDWSVSPSGKTIGVSKMTFDPILTVQGQVDVAIAAIRYAAAQQSATDGFFWVRPDVYDNVPGLRNLLLAVGGSEYSMPEIGGTAIRMTSDQAKALVNAIDQNVMTGLTLPSKELGKYLGYDAPILGKAINKGPTSHVGADIVWQIGTDTVTMELRDLGPAGLQWVSVNGPTQPSLIAGVAELVRLADRGVANLRVEVDVWAAIPNLDKFLIGAGAKIDGSTLVLDAGALAQVRNLVGKDIIPTQLGGDPVKFAVLDTLVAPLKPVLDACNAHTVESGTRFTSSIVASGAKVQMTYTKSSGAIFWATIERGRTTAGQQRIATVAQLRAFAHEVAQSQNLARLDISVDVTTMRPELVAVLKKFGAKERPPTSGGPAYWSMERKDVLRLMKALDAELVDPAGTTTWLGTFLATVNWPDAEDLTVVPMHLGGQTPKVVLKDSAGNQYLFKIGATGRGTETDKAVAELSRILGLPAPPVRTYTVVINGEAKTGSLQFWVPAKSMRDAGVATPAGLTDKQTASMFQHSFLDWVVANDDAHIGNWMIDADGHLWAIDRTRAYESFNDGRQDVLNTASEGNGGGTPWLFQFFREARRDPTLLAKVRPQDLAVSMRALRAMSDVDFIALMEPVARLARNPKYRGKPERMLADMLKRKHEAVGDFERYISSEIRLMLADPAKAPQVPTMWSQWLQAGGRFNLDQTPLDMAQERLDGLLAKHLGGRWDPVEAKSKMGSTRLARVTSMLQTYFHSKSLPGPGFGAEGMKPNLLLAGLQQEVIEWEELNEMSILAVALGGSSGNSTADNVVRSHFNPETGLFRIVRTDDRFGGDPSKYPPGWDRAGWPTLRGGAMGQYTYVDATIGAGGVVILVEVPASQVYSLYFMGYGLGGEHEIMFHDLRPEQVIAIFNNLKKPGGPGNANTPLSQAIMDAIRDYMGPRFVH